MNAPPPRIVVATRDLDLAHATSLAAPGEWTDWRLSLGLALTAIDPSTRVLVLDESLDAPAVRLLGALFVGQREGRRAVIVRDRGEAAGPSMDQRVILMERPVTLEDLARSIGDDTIPSMRPQSAGPAGAAA